MLTGRPTKYGTGIELFGDYYDLKSLHNTVHSLAGREDSPGNSLFMDFAYEIRKANANSRETDVFDFADELIIYRGFKMYWTHFLITVKIMRENAGYLPTSTDIQADIYRLESIVETCLKSYDQITGTEIFDWLNHYNVARTEYIDLLVMQITSKNLREKDGKHRFKQLKMGIEILLYNHPYHIEFKKILEEEAKRLNCKISNLNLDMDYSKIKFKW